MFIGEIMGYIVNVNIVQRVSDKCILLKVPCGGRAGASPEHQPLSEQQYESGFR